MRELARAPRLAPPGNTLEGLGVGKGVDSPLAHRTTIDSDATPAAPLPEPGAVLDGRYRLDAVLGAGGMGVVYTATHLTTGKHVAIKWMRARERSSDEQAKAAERFVREAKAAARIEHPNVVDVYDVGGDPLTPYLVMERLRGENLRTRLERQPLSWEEAVRLLAPVMQALGRAHAVGVVHRDLKPDNLFLAERPDGEHLLKVLDFGISRLASYGDDVEVSLTRTGAMIGTPVYMPLEQLRGASDLDGRTDVYALGVVLYEALTGQRPFPARNPAEYGALLASSEPLPLSALRPELKGAREDVVMRALARDREDRFESMEAFREALLATAGPTPALSSPRGRVLALALAGAAVCALLAIVLLRGSPHEPLRVESEPARPHAAGTQPAHKPDEATPRQLPSAPPVREAPASVALGAPAPPVSLLPVTEPKRPRKAKPGTPGPSAKPALPATPATPTGSPAASPEDPALMKRDEF